MLSLVQLYKTAIRVIWCRVRVPTALYDKGEANDYIIIYYYVVHQSTYSIVVIVVGYQPCVRIAMAISMACY